MVILTFYTQALALLSFSSFVLSRAPPQIPLGTSNEVNNNNATVELFPAPPRIDDALVLEKCSPAELSNTLSLAAEACLSGDYHLSHNLRINTTPTCPNGEVPVLLYYPHRGCTGEPTYHTGRKGHDIPINECLFEESQMNGPWFSGAAFGLHLSKGLVLASMLSLHYHHHNKTLEPPSSQQQQRRPPRLRDSASPPPVTTNVQLATNK